MATARLNLPTVSSFAGASVADALVEKARSLRAFFQKEAPEGEKRRNPTPAAANVLKDEGFLRMLLPERLGGLGLSPTDYSRVQIEIGKGDPSISWL